MKLIDAEELKVEILKAPVWTGLDAIAKINTIPSIDIIRCKDCVHWHKHKNAEYDQSKFTYYCDIHGIFLKGDDYCSQGERSK